MTRLQFDRWQQFALAMAARGFVASTPARAEKRVYWAREFFALLENDAEWQEWNGWDASEPGAGYCTDWFTEWCQVLPGYGTFGDRNPDRWRWPFADELHCCLRAGLDVAASPSAGVLGFRVGDLRRMFPDGLPDWVAAFFTPDLAEAEDREPVWL